MNSTCVKRVLDICRCSVPFVFRVPWEVVLGIIPIDKNVLDLRAHTKSFHLAFYLILSVSGSLYQTAFILQL